MLSPNSDYFKTLVKKTKTPLHTCRPLVFGLCGMVPAESSRPRSESASIQLYWKCPVSVHASALMAVPALPGASGTHHLAPHCLQLSPCISFTIEACEVFPHPKTLLRSPTLPSRDCLESSFFSLPQQIAEQNQLYSPASLSVISWLCSSAQCRLKSASTIPLKPF